MCLYQRGVFLIVMKADLRVCAKDRDCQRDYTPLSPSATERDTAALQCINIRCKQKKQMPCTASTFCSLQGMQKQSKFRGKRVFRNVENKNLISCVSIDSCFYIGFTKLCSTLDRLLVVCVFNITGSDYFLLNWKQSRLHKFRYQKMHFCI
jgi:hypothetical protein